MNDAELVWTECAPMTYNRGALKYPRYRSQTFEHGLKDAKGRAIGNFAEIEAAPEGGSHYNLVEEGTPTVYLVGTYATRDGHKFGAIPRTTKCKTLEEAKALAAKKLAAAAKRYARAVQSGAGRQFAKP